jgi:hypothetical protein
MPLAPLHYGTEDRIVTQAQKIRLSRRVLPVIGAIFIAGVWLLMQVWPAGWAWQPDQPEFRQMILGVYATLGVFLVIAARDPAQHRSLILFTAWSSIVHSGIMAAQAIVDATERGHFLGDVPALALVGIVLLVLAPEASSAPAAHREEVSWAAPAS